jgi:hypothetical protein
MVCNNKIGSEGEGGKNTTDYNLILSNWINFFDLCDKKKFSWILNLNNRSLEIIYSSYWLIEYII